MPLDRIPILVKNKNMKNKKLYAIPFEPIPPEYWLFMALWYRDNLPEVLMKRSHVSRHASKKSFKKGMRTQKKNVAPAPQRGGYRL